MLVALVTNITYAKDCHENCLCPYSHHQFHHLILVSIKTNTLHIKFVTNGKGPGQKVRIFNTFFAPLCWSNTSWGETQFAVILSVKACVTKTVWNFGIEKNWLEKFTSRMQAGCIFDCVVYRCYRKAFIACKQPRRWRRGRVPLLRMRYMHFADSAQPAPHTYGAIWKSKRGWLLSHTP